MPLDNKRTGAMSIGTKIGGSNARFADAHGAGAR